MKSMKIFSWTSFKLENMVERMFRADASTQPDGGDYIILQPYPECLITVPYFKLRPNIFDVPEYF